MDWRKIGLLIILAALMVALAILLIRRVWRSMETRNYPDLSEATQARFGVLGGGNWTKPIEGNGEIVAEVVVDRDDPPGKIIL